MVVVIVISIDLAVAELEDRLYQAKSMLGIKALPAPSGVQPKRLFMTISAAIEAFMPLWLVKTFSLTRTVHKTVLNVMTLPDEVELASVGALTKIDSPTAGDRFALAAVALELADVPTVVTTLEPDRL